MIDTAAGIAMSGGLSAGLGAGLSLLGKLSEAKQRADQLKLARNEKELKIITASMDAAANRANGPGGVAIRRFIVIALFAFLYAILPINGIIQHFMTDGGIPATFAHVTETSGWFWGLFPGKTKLVTTPIQGIPIFRIYLEMGWLIACFYFGSSRIK